jgi:hypothetical protein
MIGTIRKHAAWLWWLIAGLTIISFVVFMGSGATRGSRGGGVSDYGLIYGHQVTPEEYFSAQRDFYFYYWMQHHEWPDKSASVPKTEISKQSYVRVMLALRAKSLGIYIPDDAIKADAAMVLAAVGRDLYREGLTRDSQPIPIDQFVDGVLKPEGLTADDFQHYIQSDLAIQQLISALGLPGAFVTPQEAATLYDREYEEASVQAVFFDASNYLDRVTVSPAEVGQYFTNYMTYYRVPDRIQVYYIWWNVTNYLAQSKAEWAKTNFEETVTAVYTQHAAQFTDAKTPEEAKEKVRNALIRQRAMSDAAMSANDFIATLYAMEPVKFENFPAAAKQKGLEAKISEPFSENDVPLEFINAPQAEKTAAALTADSPFSSRIGADDGIFVMGLARQIPSSIPDFNTISDRVTGDLRLQKAAQLARAAGTNFYTSATVAMAVGKSTFAQAAIAAGLTPDLLTRFSRNTASVPEINEQGEFNYIKSLAFNMPLGGISPFVPTAEGGFVLQVKAISPVDPTKKAADLAGFMQQVRRSREYEAFNVWVNTEMNRELRNNSAFAAMTTEQEK